MKNRKIVVVSFLLVAVMLLGIGYANLTDTLNIIGDAEVSHANANSAFDADVYFSAVSEGVGYTASIDEPDKASFKVTGLSGGGESISITYTITNDNEFPASVIIDATNTTTTNATYFTCTSDKGDGEAIVIDASSTETVTLTITLIETPILAENQTVSCVFSVEFDVSSVEEQ